MLAGTLAHYRVELQLGAGGMGVVYEATDVRLGRRVAIKVLHDGSLKDPDTLVRFEREAKVLASLTHANIGAIHGLEQVGDLAFLVLEYVPGDTLAERLTRSPAAADGSSRCGSPDRRCAENGTLLPPFNAFPFAPLHRRVPNRNRLLTVSSDGR
jgi:serine/threonine protein kinase